MGYDAARIAPAARVAEALSLCFDCAVGASYRGAFSLGHLSNRNYQTPLQQAPESIVRHSIWTTSGTYAGINSSGL
jgi:hypothetical protein